MPVRTAWQTKFGCLQPDILYKSHLGSFSTLVNDLRGRRISEYEIRSGTYGAMHIALDANGTTEKGLLPVCLKPVLSRDN